MSKFVILPTFDLVTECEAYDNMFRLFIQGGVKAIIKDTVMSTSFQHSLRKPVVKLSDVTFSLHGHQSPIVDYVLNQFEQYAMQQQRILLDDGVMDQLTEKPIRFDVESHLNRLGELEMVTQWIDDLVLAMMEDIFRDRPYQINERVSRWSGRDLMIGVEPISSQWGQRRAL